MVHPFFRGAAGRPIRILPRERNALHVNTLLLLVIVCPLLGAGVFAGAVLLAVGVAALLRFTAVSARGGRAAFARPATGR
jgi:hypothetical protein